MNKITISKEYLEAGFCTLPTVPGEKRPATGWTQYQKRKPTEQELETLFSNAGAGCGIGIICGSVSGGLECIDFDNQGAAYPDWQERIPSELFNKLAIERTPSGGYHAYYRAPNIAGSQKLAMKQDGKTVLIETRGQGGFVKCAPSDGYSLIQGSFDSLPMLTTDERETLIESARLIDERQPEPIRNKPEQNRQYNGESPADAYTQTADVLELLQAHGWEIDHTAPDGNVHLTRPGKGDGTSGTLKENENGIMIFYPFTTSTEFAAGRGYNAFQIYSIYEHGGNESKAARALLKKGCGGSNRKTDGAAEAGTDSKDELNLEALGRSTNRRSVDEMVTFPLDALPMECRRFILDVARAQGQDPAPIAAVLLAEVAGVVGGAVRLKAGAGWYVSPVLWLGLIGISGQGKSPIIDSVRRLISKASKEYHERYLQELIRYNTALNKWQKQQKSPTAEPTPPPEMPIERKIYITDATFEGLVRDVSGSCCRTPLILDELVALFQMLRRTGTPGEESKWLAGYNGGGVRTSRTTAKETYIEHAYWGIWGGTTPEKFRSYLESGGGDKDGTLSRFNFVWIPDSPTTPQLYSESGESLADDPMVEKHFEQMRETIEAVIGYNPEGRDEQGELLGYTELRLCKEAGHLWAQRVTDYGQRLKGALGEDTDAESGYISKCKELPIRIAISLHVLKSAREYCNLSYDIEDLKFTLPKEVTLETYKEAEQIALWFEGEGLDNYKRFGFLESNEKMERRKLILCISNAGIDGISERGIYQKLQSYKTKTGRAKLQAALNELESAGRVYKKSVKPPKGRVYILYYVTKE